MQGIFTFSAWEYGGLEGRYAVLLSLSDRNVLIGILTMYCLAQEAGGDGF